MIHLDAPPECNLDGCILRIHHPGCPPGMHPLDPCLLNAPLDATQMDALPWMHPLDKLPPGYTPLNALSGQTDAYENITLMQLRLRAGKS